MSWDSELMEILKISHDNAGEISHLNARAKVYGHASDLQWFSELLKRQGEARMADPISTPVDSEKLSSMLFEVSKSVTADESNGRPHSLTRVRIPVLSGIKVRMPRKILEVDVVEEPPVTVVEETAQPILQEPPVQTPKPRKSVKKPRRAKQSVAPAQPKKPREPAKKPVEVDARPVPPPKPLKVIRRRRAEEPKVFETAPKSFPRAMLEGVKVTPEEKGEQPLD